MFFLLVSNNCGQIFHDFFCAKMSCIRVCLQCIINFLFKYYCFPFDIVLQMFWQNISCYSDDEIKTVYKYRIGVIRLWNTFKQILPHTPLKLLKNVFNQTFVWTKQLTHQITSPFFFFFLFFFFFFFFFFLICSHRSIRKIN